MSWLDKVVRWLARPTGSEIRKTKQRAKATWKEFWGKEHKTKSEAPRFQFKPLMPVAFGRRLTDGDLVSISNIVPETRDALPAFVLDTDPFPMVALTMYGIHTLKRETIYLRLLTGYVYCLEAEVEIPDGQIAFAQTWLIKDGKFIVPDMELIEGWLPDTPSKCMFIAGHARNPSVALNGEQPYKS